MNFLLPILQKRHLVQRYLIIGTYYLRYLLYVLRLKLLNRIRSYLVKGNVAETEIFYQRKLAPPIVKDLHISAITINIACLIFVIVMGLHQTAEAIKPLISPLHPLKQSKPGYEIFGFAPYWTFNKLGAVDFNVLTTMAYFGVDVQSDGNLDKSGPGYDTFHSDKATDVFQRAHNAGTRVVLTLTQMDNSQILGLLDDSSAQDNTIDQAVSEVKNRGIDGINVDFEYAGDPGDDYRNKFSQFVAHLTNKMHQAVPSSKVTVSVYAASVKDPKIYDVASLSKSSDNIFMMAYDFASTGSDVAMPTDPLYGYKTGQYWYDISTAVDDFLSQMPAEKLILGVPWYGYNYLVYEPGVKATTRPYYSWRGKPTAQTYSSVADNITEDSTDVSSIQKGWDDVGKVGWKAYYVSSTDTWRIVFLDDTKSLDIKYDFAKNKRLAGVGIWALGFEDGKKELWTQLSEKFGIKLADNNVTKKQISQ